MTTIATTTTTTIATKSGEGGKHVRCRVDDTSSVVVAEESVFEDMSAA